MDRGACGLQSMGLQRDRAEQLSMNARAFQASRTVRKEVSTPPGLW